MALHFDLTDLRLMLRVAESGSLTRAAEAVHLSLPAASTRIKHLEEGAGARLLLRTPQGVSLTPPGQALVHHARVVLAQIEHLRDDLQEYAEGIKGHLRVYANSTALCEYLPPVLHRYLQGHPDVSVDLRERLSHDVVRAVQEGQTDIGIVAGNVPTDGLQVRPYRSDRLVLVVPAGHALAEAGAVDFVDTLAWPHVGLTEASALHTFLRRICEGLQRTLRVRIEVGNFEAACRMIEAGIGVGVLPASAAGRHAATLGIHLVPLRDAWALREMQVCVRNLEALPPFARDLVDLLDEDAGAVRTPPTPAPTPGCA